VTYEPRLSVVVAATGQGDTFDACLCSITSQQRASEVLVVSTNPPPADFDYRFEGCRWLECRTEALIPHLWQMGMDAACGDVVAITTSQFVPADDWIEQIVRAHQEHDTPAVGGRIDPPTNMNPVAWATYFLRYNTYLDWTTKRWVSDIAGDNASYKHDALLRHRAALPDGFWEPDFHRLLLAEGKRLFYTPDIRVRQMGSSGFWTFCKQRYRHARQFGQARLRGKSVGERVFRVVTSPLIPMVFLVKIARAVIGGGARYWGPFVFSLPALSCFLLAWAAGECGGYLAGPVPEEGEAPSEPPKR